MIIRVREFFSKQGIAGFLQRPQDAFLVLALFFGTVFVFLVPPMQSPDEVEHFFRSYQISQFNIKSDVVDNGYGGALPESIIESSKRFKEDTAGHPEVKFDQSLLGSEGLRSLHPENQETIRFDNTTIYSPVPYLPQVLGIGLARAFHADPLIILYVGRIFNLVAWVLMIYLAIRISPIGKWVFLVVALNPVALFLASTLSSDAVSIGLVALLTAVVMRLRLAPQPLKPWMVAGIALLPICLALTKNAYIPLVFLFLLIPKEIITTWIRVLIVAIALAVSISWNLMVLPMADNIPEYFGIAANIDKSEQANAIINQPWVFLGALTDSLVGQSSSAILPSYSGIFGWLDTPNPYWISMLFYTTLLIAIFYKDSESKRLIKRISTRTRVVIGLLLAVSVLALLTTLYAGFTQVGKARIEGIQGRYFIPLTFFAIPLFLTSLVELKMPMRIFPTLIVSLLCVVYIATFITVFVRYY